MEDTLALSDRFVDLTRVSSVWKLVELMASVNFRVDSLAEVNIFKVVECVSAAAVVVVDSVNLMVVLVVASVCCCIVWIT